MTSDACHVSVVGASTGAIIAFGVWVSWLPQQVAFLRSKNTFGVSTAFIILTQIANWFPFIAGLFKNKDVFDCCSHVSFWQCQGLLVPLYQLGISVFSVFCIHTLYVIYFNPNPSISDTTPEERDETKIEAVFSVNEAEIDILDDERDAHVARMKRFQWTLYVSTLVCMFDLIVVGFIYQYGSSEIVSIYADALGILGTVIVLAQFTPQLIETYKLKTAGNLSMVMLLIQVPGTWIWFFDMVFFEGEAWAVWLSTFVAAVQVTMLFSQVLYYDVYLRRKRERSHFQGVLLEDDDEDDEQF
eukprot:TRINITY_DN2247_c0_g1_i1.p1 TRINITY_DN2247_c0_g1~~TRINITY_DN2247_c0_g1_i1.p1  ORF type:complete len:307 (+),score=98.94 TRINITY_DN2247_c0_g1_i1:23-922(+)